MEIEITAGGKTYQLRGTLRAYEICELKTRTEKETGEKKQEWEPFRWYMTIEQALTELMNMKLRTCDAASLSELQMEIRRVKEEIRGLYEVSAR
jgi:hypothetical protein